MPRNELSCNDRELCDVLVAAMACEVDALLDTTDEGAVAQVQSPPCVVLRTAQCLCIVAQMCAPSKIAPGLICLKIKAKRHHCDVNIKEYEKH